MTAVAAEGSPRTTMLTGTLRLVRFILRKDRVKLPAWILSIAVFISYYVVALPTIFESEEKLRSMGSQFADGPIGALVGGPTYGFDNLTFPRFMFGVYGLYFLLAAALMNILLVTRNSRAEEESGRGELIRAGAVGRQANLTAVLLVALSANIALALLMGLAAAGSGYPFHGSMLMGASVGGVGLVFASIAAVTNQMTPFARSASSMAGAALGAAWVIRTAGDMLTMHGSLLSWFSPLAWSQQTRPYVDERWWPLGLSVGFSLLLAALAFRISSRRDFGTGVRQPKPGSPQAAPWISSPWRFAFRLQKGSIIGWGIGLGIAGAIYGAIGGPMSTAFSDMGETFKKVFGLPSGEIAAGAIKDSYFAMMALVDAIVLGVFGILVLQYLRSHEEEGLTEPILATRTSRVAWMGGHLAVAAIAGTILLTFTGLILSTASSFGFGDVDIIREITWAHFVRTPEFLITLGVAALLYGWAPRFLGVAWAFLAYGMLISFFGPLMEPPQWLYNIGMYDHIARYPFEPLTGTPILVQTGLALIAALLGLWGFARRDIQSN